MIKVIIQAALLIFATSLDANASNVGRVVANDNDANSKNKYPFISNLLSAIVNDDIKSVQTVLSNSGNINARHSDGLTALPLAVVFGNKDIVKLLLNFGADVDLRGSNAKTALMLAAKEQKYPNDDYVEITKELLSHKANINLKDDKGWTALIYAVYFRNSRIAKLLIEHGADINAMNSEGKTALHYAVYFQRIDILPLLLESGANPNMQQANGNNALMALSKSTISYRSEAYDLLIAEQLINHNVKINELNNEGLSALLLAAKAGKSKMIGLLIKNNASLNIKGGDGRSALVYAYQSGIEEAVDIIRENGNSLNMSQIEKNADWLLSMSARIGDINTIRKILETGLASIDVSNSLGITALMEAAGAGKNKVVNYLLDNGANVNLKTHGKGVLAWNDISPQHEYTALYMAIVNHHTEIVKTLLKHGASKTIKLKSGMSPLDWAKHKQFMDIISLLENNSYD